jgi:peptidoglycan-N-acetylglucosamine deacetylase
MDRWFGSAFILLSVYTIIPTLVIHIINFVRFKKGSDPSIALTFDDGPDPVYTPLLLDLLRAYEVKATFFVLGSRAELYPDLIKRIQQEGHLIGIHNYVHWSNGLMTPRKVRRELHQAAVVIERITGERLEFYRPPWGIINIFDFLLLRRYRFILWSVMVGDWVSRGGRQKIKRRLFAKLKRGTVILLHDNGATLGADEDAPGHMIAALQDFLEENQRKNYKYLRIDDKIRLEEEASKMKAGLSKRLLVAIWLKWERGIHRILNLQPVDPDNNLLNIRICTYRGTTIHLSDGEKIEKGDRVVELHLDNEKLYKLGLQARSPVQLAVQLIRSIQQLMPRLSSRIASDPNGNLIKGVYGITMIHRGTQQLGFTTMDLPNGIFFKLTRGYLRWLLFVIHPQGQLRLETKRELLTPKTIAISTKELKRRYPVDAVENHVGFAAKDHMNTLAEPVHSTSPSSK